MSGIENIHGAVSIASSVKDDLLLEVDHGSVTRQQIKSMAARLENISSYMKSLATKLESHDIPSEREQAAALSAVNQAIIIIRLHDKVEELSREFEAASYGVQTLAEEIQKISES